MINKEVLEEIKSLLSENKKGIDYNKLIDIIEDLTPSEIIELSHLIGNPIFTNLSKALLKHKFVLFHDGTAAIVVNDKGQILLVNKVNTDKWFLPFGYQEFGERSEDAVIREVKEKINIDVTEDNLELIGVVPCSIRRNNYNKGITVNNTILYCVKDYAGEIQNKNNSFEFFDLDNLPVNQNDSDLIEMYRAFLNKKSRQLKKMI